MRTIQIKATLEQYKKIIAFAEKIGAKVIKSDVKKSTSKKEEVHTYIIDIIEIREDS